MICNATNLADQSVVHERYKPAPINTLPCIVMGFVMKNRYDEQRLKIKKILAPVNLEHEYKSSDGVDKIYIHGIKLEPLPSVNHLCEAINRARPITPHSYKNILKYNRLSCDNCVQHLRDGVYPIDVNCLPLMSRNRFKSDYLYLRSLLEHDETLPWFSSWSEFNIFMLCPSFIHTPNYK